MIDQTQQALDAHADALQRADDEFDRACAKADRAFMDALENIAPDVLITVGAKAPTEIRDHAYGEANLAHEAAYAAANAELRRALSAAQ
jgi:hypothetical protein